MLTFQVFLLFITTLTVAKSEIDHETVCKSDYRDEHDNKINILEYCSNKLCIEKCCRPNELLLGNCFPKERVLRKPALIHAYNNIKNILSSRNVRNKTSAKTHVFVYNHRSLKHCTAEHLITDEYEILEILCTLSFLANGSYQKIIKENIRTYLSQPSASRCINEVVEALNNPAMVKKYIRFPQNRQERQMLKERFYKKFGFPAALGCVDGTLVALKKPVENEERFYCRKGYHARNVQLITDADLNILNVDPTYGGATHDSFIFNYSDIKAHLEALTNAGEEVILLGDSGYAQRAYLMTPISGAEENSPEAFYNDRHITARNSVERTIGLLKGRFRCLLVHRVLNYHPDIVAKIVIACCVLHNLCNRSGMPVVTISEEERLDELQTIAEVQRRQTRDLPSNTDLALGQLRRRNLVDRLWRSRHN